MFFCEWEIVKKNCWGCGSDDVIKWGFQNGKQRFKCKNCGLLFTWQNKSVKQKNQFVWFERWVLHRQTFEYLSQQSGYSIRTLKSLFHTYLAAAPVLRVYPSEQLHLLIDGTYFSNDICLIVYRDNEIKFTQLYRLSDGEHFTEIKEDLENLLRLGVNIKSITCDGHKAILKAIKYSCTDTIVQRCLVHIQRECRIWLTQRPKSDQGSELLHIVNQLSLINDEPAYQYWLKQLYDWHKMHKTYIAEKSFSVTTNRYWYKHKMVRRAFIHLKNALPKYVSFSTRLQNPKINKRTGIFFRALKKPSATAPGINQRASEKLYKMVSVLQE